MRRYRRVRRSVQAGEINKELNRKVYGGTTVYNVSDLSFSSPSGMFFDHCLNGWVSPESQDEIIISDNPVGDNVYGARLRFLIVLLADGSAVPYSAQAHNQNSDFYVLSHSWDSDHRYDQGMGDGFVGMVHAYPISDGADIGSEIILKPALGYFPPCVIMSLEKDTVGLGNVSTVIDPDDGYDFSPYCSGDVSVALDDTMLDGATGWDNGHSNWEYGGPIGTPYMVEASGGPSDYSFMADSPGYIPDGGVSATYYFDESC